MFGVPFKHCDCECDAVSMYTFCCNDTITEYTPRGSIRGELNTCTQQHTIKFIHTYTNTHTGHWQGWAMSTGNRKNGSWLWSGLTSHWLNTGTLTFWLKRMRWRDVPICGGVGGDWNSYRMEWCSDIIVDVYTQGIWVQFRLPFWYLRLCTNSTMLSACYTVAYISVQEVVAPILHIYRLH